MTKSNFKMLVQIKICKAGIKALDFCKTKHIEEENEINFNEATKIDFSNKEILINPYLKDLFNDSVRFEIRNKVKENTSVLFLDTWDFENNMIHSNNHNKSYFGKIISDSKISIEKIEEKYYLFCNLEGMFLLENLIKKEDKIIFSNQYKLITRGIDEIGFPYCMEYGGKCVISGKEILEMFKNKVNIINEQKSQGMILESIQKLTPQELHNLMTPSNIKGQAFANKNSDYCSILEKFDGYEWVKFYICKKEIAIEFEKGLCYKGRKGLKKFERNVEEKYGFNKNSLIYRKYMLEADKLRLEAKLGRRKCGIEPNIIFAKNIQILISNRQKQINQYLKRNKRRKDFELQHKLYFNDCEYILWFELAKIAREEDYKYVTKYVAQDSLVYDLVVISYGINGNVYDFTIPTTILAKALQVPISTFEKLFNK